MSRKRTSLDAIVNRSVVESQVVEPPASTVARMLVIPSEKTCPAGWRTGLVDET